MQEEKGFRLVIDKGLLTQSGTVSVDYLTGPMRRGFQIKASAQSGGGCQPPPGGCSCG